MKAFVDFYSKEGISPVSQDISDLGRHFRRRGALYRHLGIIPALVEGKRALEFGPGSGHNALYTASLEPESYVLVEGNPVGRERTETLLREYFPDQSIEVRQSLIEEYRDDNRYHLVLCEGLLPLQEDPVSIIRHSASFLAQGGCLVVTCTDSVTYLAELLRRLFALIVTEPGQTTEEKLAILLPIFSPQLQMIEGMSRPHDEYILDNIVQPFAGRKLFGVHDAIDAVSDMLTAYKTSPEFVDDWRWYKKITGATGEFNSRVRDSYLSNWHNFMDSRTGAVGGTIEANLELAKHCDAVYEEILRFEEERGNAALANIQRSLIRIEEIVRGWSERTADSLKEYLRNFEKVRAGEGDFEWGDFCDWFGQAQVYVSFLNDL